MRVGHFRRLSATLLAGDALWIDFQEVFIRLHALVVTSVVEEAMRVCERILFRNVLGLLLSRHDGGGSRVGLRVNDGDRADQSRREDADDRK